MCQKWAALHFALSAQLAPRMITGKLSGAILGTRRVNSVTVRSVMRGGHCSYPHFVNKQTKARELSAFEGTQLSRRRDGIRTHADFLFDSKVTAASTFYIHFTCGILCAFLQYSSYPWTTNSKILARYMAACLRAHFQQQRAATRCAKVIQTVSQPALRKVGGASPVSWVAKTATATTYPRVEASARA